MSALSLISQFPTLSIPVGAGGANNGAQDVLITDVVVTAGTYIGSIIVTLAGAGVTSGDMSVTFGATPICTAVMGAVGVNPSSTATFFYTSDGVTALSVAVVGDGANWTSGATTLRLRQIA
jgi:hypothetical protein